MNANKAHNKIMDIKIKPVINKPALIISNTIDVLAVADIHLGIEWDLYRSGFSIPSLLEKKLSQMQELIRETEPDRVVLVGDVKHNVPSISWQERREVPLFLHNIAQNLPVDIIPGNHDGGIELLYEGNKNITLHPSRGACIDSVGYFHGHTWPSPEVISCSHIITAHNHPSVRLTDSLGYSTSEPVWIRTRIDPTTLPKYEKVFIPELTPRPENINSEIIIMPAFNELCGGIAFNEIQTEELLGPAFSAGVVEFDTAEAYMLDGTRLGMIQDIRKFSNAKRKKKFKRSISSKRYSTINER
ncbi:metallophosphoesterase [Methanosalsum zhilinae DSM 4017]|uniref:Metallophosphoesterase n=1 Tax=Methanosalsum zhilinae (strain DSM 4017 / NBRC 107636 / OCM 62 / WeN5) TaxID=679901 RepID=F7XMR5_METZD|nr:metallophosphoesterase [Methanosalsum zhilinae]AEH61090.1 metallophosphoesterase [Methanosalsum zhilinae DSM 4017]